MCSYDDSIGLTLAPPFTPPTFSKGALNAVNRRTVAVPAITADSATPAPPPPTTHHSHGPQCPFRDENTNLNSVSHEVGSSRGHISATQKQTAGY